MARKSDDARSSGEAWFNRLQVAALLGITEGQVEEMHGQELHPWKEKDRRWRYRPEDVVRAFRLRSASDPASQGKITAKAFGMFREGKNMAEVVEAVEQPATVVRQLFGDYREMAGGLPLFRANVESLGGLVGSDGTASGDALVSAVAKELAGQYAKGRAEGKMEAEDYGEVVDLKTGERRRLPPR